MFLSDSMRLCKKLQKQGAYVLSIGIPYEHSVYASIHFVRHRGIDVYAHTCNVVF